MKLISIIEIIIDTLIHNQFVCFYNKQPVIGKTKTFNFVNILKLIFTVSKIIPKLICTKYLQNIF